MSKNGKNKVQHDIIPLEEIRTSINNGSGQRNQYSFSQDEVSSDDDEENVHYHKNVPKKSQVDQLDSHENIPELPGLSNLSIGASDVLFNCIVFLFSVAGLILEIVLVFWHYKNGDSVACGLTFLWIVIGGFGILKTVWGISQDKLERLYGKRAKCVRLTVNCFPWISNILTPFLTTLTCKKAIKNSMQIHTYVQLQHWCRLLLRVQSFCQAAPQSVTQLVILLEELDFVTSGRATTMILCIVTCLTNMMIANLPIKSDNELSKAAYSPYSRIFIGLRMISSFGSRTMSLALFISAFRCLKTSHPDISGLALHLIPLSIVVFPRIIFSVVEFISKKYSSKETTSFSNVLVIYTASIFLPFGEPRWIFWYVTIETIGLVITATVLDLVVSGCATIWISILYICLFLALFLVVPVVIPFLLWISK